MPAPLEMPSSLETVEPLEAALPGPLFLLRRDESRAAFFFFLTPLRIGVREETRTNVGSKKGVILMIYEAFSN